MPTHIILKSLNKPILYQQLNEVALCEYLRQFPNISTRDRRRLEFSARDLQVSICSFLSVMMYMDDGCKLGASPRKGLWRQRSLAAVNDA